MNGKSRRILCQRRRPQFWCALLLLCLAVHAPLGQAQTQPSVTTTRPADGATGVPRDDFVSADVFVPNGGINPAILTDSTVYLYRTSDATQQHVPAVLNTSGGGDVIVLDPVDLLDANTSYTFVVTSGLKDISGVSFIPYQMSFTTGTTSGGSDASIRFEKLVQSSAPARNYTCVTIGPDGKLYASANNGEILRFPINADGTLGAAQSLMSLRTANGGDRLLIGMKFDPTATADNLILWVSHSAFTFSNGPDWAGKITRLSGPNLETVQDYVVNLPRSTRDHVTNQLDFGPDGALYFLQGSTTAMGAPDSAWDFRAEHLLNAAVLRLDIPAISALPLDVKTEDGGTYDPFGTYAPLTLFATGVRNAYDLVWHRNGSLYAPTNGSASGGNTPGTPDPLPAACNNRIDGAYTGPAVPGIDRVNQTMDDFLFRVVQGGYYGHPNPKRCEWVLNGGNPTAGVDPAEVTQYPVGTQPDRNWRGFAYDFGQHWSPDGIIEYKNGAFNGALVGDLLVVRYSGGDDIIALKPGPGGNIISVRTNITGMTGFTDPLDLVENPANGFIYVAEYGGQRLNLLRPLIAPNAPTALTATIVSSSQINLTWTDNANNESGFKIERSLDGSSFTQIATVGANVTSYNNTGLAESTTYYYRVRSYNSSGDSAYTNTASATTPGAPPNAPTGLTATAFSSSQINLAWTDNSSNESGFKIERKTGATGTYAEVATVGMNVTSYSDSGLTGETTYYYRVRSYNPNGASAYSNEANATTTGPPGTGLRGDYYDNADFTNFKLTRTDATVNFDWGSGSPAPTIGPDTFSVHWIGQVLPRYSQTTRFIRRSTMACGCGSTVSKSLIAGRTRLPPKRIAGRSRSPPTRSMTSCWSSTKTPAMRWLNSPGRARAKRRRSSRRIGFIRRAGREMPGLL